MVRAVDGQTQRRQSSQHPDGQLNTPSGQCDPQAVTSSGAADAVSSVTDQSQVTRTTPQKPNRHMTTYVTFTSDFITYTNIGIAAKDIITSIPNIFRPQQQQRHTVSANQPCGRSEVAPMLR